MLATAPTTPLAAASSAESVSNFRAVLSSQALLNQLRAHYATGCLLSDLVQAQGDQFIVKAIVEVEGRALASALASASTVEAAEDRARIRVLAVLGISATAPYVSSNVSSNMSSMAVPMADIAEVAGPIAGSIARPGVDVSVAKGIPGVASGATSGVTSRAASGDSGVNAEPGANSATPKRKTKAEKAKLEKGNPEDPIASVAVLDREAEVTVASSVSPLVAAIPGASAMDLPMDLPVEAFEPMEYEYIPEEEPAFMAAEPAEPPMDLSDAIAQIGAEIDRIGWTKKQGSAYLQETYGKRTRAELTEAELFAFLKYLKSLPSKMQPNLSQIPF
ncbi:hypothetical protein [Alkalinema sp. FACHB-956]|uniref:hypothetical protein n=1 Tax=Alkalinema sp. FACHB-956 TaxID=2692768 RepID=UPI00168606D3|nr:hypothetical protein [Alkalinema sp. FACHB-956]MBD2326156.1 hypothetical protein [Alkalinema sp. FACHB-956]